MKHPTPSDFIVNVEESNVSVIFKPSGPAADEFTIALDRCGWMIVPLPPADGSSIRRLSGVG